jgi:two-component system chemotaxis response regulator CheB
LTTTLNVLVAIHNLAVRGSVLRLLETDQRIHVLRLVRDGRELVALVKKLRPDLVLLGVRLDRLDGLGAVQEIMRECPTPSLIIADDPDIKDEELSARAMQSGALTVLHPPLGNDRAERYRREFLDTLAVMATVKLVRRWGEKTPPPQSRKAKAPQPVQACIVAIGASTGGPAALEAIIAELPKNFPAPILVVQHIAIGFIDGVASWLDRSSRLRVKVAEDGEPLRGGTVYLAPDDRHLGVRGRSTIALSTDPPVGGFRPSASFLFDSVARAFGRDALAVILTGMGRDGLEGLRCMHSAGGMVIAQSEDSCVVFGMPGAAIEDGIAHHTISPRQIGAALAEMARPSERKR